MEVRKARMIVNKSGSGSSTFRATLPQTWVREMGLSEDVRDLILEFKEDAIMIKKDNIFLVVTEDNNIIYNIEESELESRDQAVYESDVESIVEAKLDEGYKEIDELIDDILDTITLTEEAKEVIKEEVENRIEKC